MLENAECCANFLRPRVVLPSLEKLAVISGNDKKLAYPGFRFFAED
jgi:hypothetical protein